jgi:hypothetical protein
VWGGDAPFFPTHVMMGDSAVRVVSDLIATGFKSKVASRTEFGGALQSIGNALPKGAVVLLHEHNPRLGLRAPVVMDMPRFQAGISYGLFPTNRDLFEHYRRMGVTHVVWRARQSRAFDSLAGDLRFFDFVANHTVEQRTEGRMTVGRVVPTPPAEGSEEWVAYAGCGKIYRRGVHRWRDMNDFKRSERRKVPAARPLPDDASQIEQALADVRFVVYDPSCEPRLSTSSFRGFTQVATRAKEQLWVRTTGAAPAAGPAPGSPEKDPDLDMLDDPGE